MKQTSDLVLKQRVADWVAYVLLIIPAFIYFSVVARFSQNIPFRDDFPAILKFIEDMNVAGPMEKLQLLFAQHNAHRIFFTRLVSYIYYLVTGGINFRNLIFIGNIQLILILAITVCFVQKALPNNWRIPAFVFSLMIFDISSWNNAGWAMAALQNYSVVFLFLASLYCLASPKKWMLAPAVVFQIFCIFSSGNGILGALALVVYAVLSKDKWKMIAATAVFVVFAPLYYFHYVAVPNPTGNNDIKHTIIYFFHLIGGHIYIGKRNYNDYMIEAVSVLTLVGLIVFFPIGRKRPVVVSQLPFVSTLLFILLTMVAMSYSRVINGAVPSRYLIYCHYVIGVLFVFYLFRPVAANTSKLLFITFAALMVFNYYRDFKLGLGEFRRWRYDIIHNTPDPWTPWDPAVEKSTLDKACEMGIYCRHNLKSK